MAKEFQHGFKAKQDSVNGSFPSLGLTDKEPQQMDPEVTQEKRECDKEESGYRFPSGCADAAVVLDFVIGFNTERNGAR